MSFALQDKTFEALGRGDDQIIDLSERMSILESELKEIRHNQLTIIGELKRLGDHLRLLANNRPVAIDGTAKSEKANKTMWKKSRKMGSGKST